MKHAGSVRTTVLLLVWGVVSQALTPPRIIYGGWTPILPGHPFYFGPVRQRNAEPSKEYYPGTPFKPQDSPQNEDRPEKDYKGRSPAYKDIYAYYPPQSAYEGPKQPVRDYKPVYFEDTPRKYPPPNQHQQHILPPLLENVVGKRPTAYRQILLNQDVDTGEKTFIRITPLGNVDANDLESLGQIDLSDIQFVNPNTLRNYPIDVMNYKVPDYSVLKDPVRLYPVTVKDYPSKLPYSFEAYDVRQNAVPLHYDVGGALPYKVIGASAYKTPANIYESGFSSLAGHRPITRPLNPIETKKLRNILLQADKQIADLSPPEGYHTKGPPSLYGVGKKPLSPAAKSFAKQMRAYLGSRRPTAYNGKTLSAITPYRPLPQNLAYLPLKTTSPKFSTLGSGYSDPTLKTSSLSGVGKQAIKTSPPGGRYTDGALQALKALSQGGSYSNVGLQTLKTSPPGSSYADAGLQAIKTSPAGSRYTDGTLQTLKALSQGVSYPDVGLQALKTSSQGGSYPDVGLRGLKASPAGVGYGLHQTLYKDPVSLDKEYLYLTASTPQSTQVSDEAEKQQQQAEYIFVSSSGSRGTEGGGEKQFFHAYYAPADHSPPPGYVRMAVQEFRELFRNADIRYVDGKEPAAAP